MNVAQLLLQHVFRLHGFPRVIRTDRDSRMTSQVWRDLCSLLDIKDTPTVSFAPRGNGLVERTNALVSQQLRLFCLNRQRSWMQALPTAELALNNRRLEGTSYTPFYLTYGYHCFTVSDLLHVPPTDQERSEEPRLFLARLRSDFQAFQDFLQKLARTPPTPDPRFYVGQRVLLRRNPSRRALPPGLDAHTVPAWDGPFKITEVVSSNTFRLDIPSD